MTSHHNDSVDWNVTLVDTGGSTMTGGRVKRLRSFIGDEPFLLTYGDGVADINIDALLAFHRSHGKMVTVSAVRPAARFGELEMEGDRVTRFKEKPQLHEGWINGGFFVIEPLFFDLITGDETMLEREPLEAASVAGDLMAYRHDGFALRIPKDLNWNALVQRCSRRFSLTMYTSYWWLWFHWCTAGCSSSTFGA